MEPDFDPEGVEWADATMAIHRGRFEMEIATNRVGLFRYREQYHGTKGVWRKGQPPVANDG